MQDTPVYIHHLVVHLSIRPSVSLPYGISIWSRSPFELNPQVREYSSAHQYPRAHSTEEYADMICFTRTTMMLGRVVVPLYG